MGRYTSQTLKGLAIVENHTKDICRKGKGVILVKHYGRIVEVRWVK